MDDATLNISCISQVYNESLLFSHLPPDAWYNLYVSAIGSEDPTMAYSYSDDLSRHKKRGRIKKNKSLTQRTTSSLSNLQQIWAAFDQVQPIVSCSVLFKNKASTPSDTRKCLRDPHIHHWISGHFSQYYKNCLTIISTYFYQFSMSPLIKHSCAMSYHQR